MSDDRKESLKGHAYTAFHQIFEHLSKQGNETIQATLAVMYAEGMMVPKDEKEAARWWWVAASQGDATAQFNLALLYENGQRTADYAEASVWYRLSAEQGNVKAQYKLGMMYEHGWGVKKDTVGAIKQYRRAAEQGHYVAKVNLAMIYSEDQTEIGQDLVKALMWFLVTKALSHESDPKTRDFVEKNKSTIEKKMSSKQIKNARQLAREWMEKHKK